MFKCGEIFLPKLDFYPRVSLGQHSFCPISLSGWPTSPNNSFWWTFVPILWKLWSGLLPVKMEKHSLVWTVMLTLLGKSSHFLFPDYWSVWLASFPMEQERERLSRRERPQPLRSVGKFVWLGTVCAPLSFPPLFFPNAIPCRNRRAQIDRCKRNDEGINRYKPSWHFAIYISLYSFFHIFF